MSLAPTDASGCWSADLFERVFSSSPLGMALVSADPLTSQISSVNEAFLQLVGRTRAAVRGRRLDQVFRGAAAGQVRRAVEQCLAHRRPVRIRIPQPSSAELKILELDVRALDDADPSRLMVSLMAPERPLSLAALGEQGLLAELGALSRGLVFIYDVPGAALRFGPHPMLAKLGLSLAPWPTAAITELVHPDDAQRVEAMRRDQLAAADGDVVELDFRVRGADGGWYWLGVRSQVFARTASGGVERIIGVATDQTEGYAHAAALTEAFSALARAELNERQRIGRELHDSTSQFLVAARLGLNALERQAALPADSVGLLEDVRKALSDAQHEIRNFSYVLHPPSLQQEGLARTLVSFAAGFARRTGLDVDVKVGRGPWGLPFAVQFALFRVAQEALMNVYRHAQAGRATVRLRRQRNQVVLEVEDDGVGLPGGACAVNAEGVGISGMRARMIQLGGGFELLPASPGLIVRATVAAKLQGKFKVMAAAAAAAAAAAV